MAGGSKGKHTDTLKRAAQVLRTRYGARLPARLSAATVAHAIRTASGCAPLTCLPGDPMGVILRFLGEQPAEVAASPVMREYVPDQALLDNVRRARDVYRLPSLQAGHLVPGRGPGSVMGDRPAEWSPGRK